MRPDEALPYESPEDLVEFWHRLTDEAMAAPFDLHRSYTSAREGDGHAIEEFSFRGIDGSTRHGWIAAPPEARRRPAFLWIPPYGRWSMPPNRYGTREGMVSLSFNLHGESAFHEENYTSERGYFAHGVESPATWIFRRIFGDCVLALRLLRAMPEVDETAIAAMGMSQGAGIAIWLGAWSSIVRAVVADMPFLAGVGLTLQEPMMRYPLKELREAMDAMPLGEPRVLNTLSYYDSSIVAAYCAVPTQLSLGLRDPACRPASVQRVFEALPGEKRLIQYSGGHDWDRGMVPNNREWLLRAFKRVT